MSDREFAGAPWSGMTYHRVPCANRESATAKVRRLLAPRKSDGDHELWGSGSARDWTRAALGGRTGSEAISSVLVREAATGRKAPSQRIVQLVPVLLRKIVPRQRSALS